MSSGSLFMAADSATAPDSRRAAVFVGAGLAAAAAFVAGHLAAPPVAQADADFALVMLLRFMAILKLATALGAAWLVAWRLRFPASPNQTAGYLAAVSLMAAAPGLIWQTAFVVPGAILFHAGLLMGVVLSLVDGRWRASRKARPDRGESLAAASVVNV